MDEATSAELLVPGPAIGLAGVLDVDVPDDCLPVLWHWCYLLERPRRADLGLAGHPPVGIPAPPAPGMRRMFAGGRVETRAPLRIGAEASRVTTLAGSVEKTGRSGPLTFLTVRHEISQDGVVCVVDEADIVYRPADSGGLPAEAEPAPVRPGPTFSVLADEVAMFRLSALTYNGHRIHYDREFCRAEGYADLVVHGPLQALMMAQLAAQEGVSLIGRTFAYRFVRPVIGPQTVTARAGEQGIVAGAECLDADGVRTAVAAW